MACFPARLWAPIPLLPLSIDRLHRYIHVTLLHDYSAYLLHEAGPFHWSIMKVCNVLDFTHTNLLRWSADSCSTCTLKCHEPYTTRICLRDCERQPSSLSLNIDHLRILCIYVSYSVVRLFCSFMAWIVSIQLLTRESIMKVCNVLDLTHTNLLRWSADSCTGSTYTLKRHEPYPRHICLRDYERQPRPLSLNIDQLSICIHITLLYVHAAHLWFKMLVTRASTMNVHTNVFLNTLIHRNISPSYWNMLKCWCAHGLFITGKSIAYF